MILPVVPKLNVDIGWKLALVIGGFYAFIMILLALGLIAFTTPITTLLGIFMLILVTAAAFTGRIAFGSPLFMLLLIVGAVLTVMNPFEELTVGTIYRGLGLQNVILRIKEVNL